MHLGLSLSSKWVDLCFAQTYNKVPHIMNKNVECLGIAHKIFLSNMDGWRGGSKSIHKTFNRIWTDQYNTSWESHLVGLVWVRIIHHTNPSTQLHQNVVNLVNVEGKVMMMQKMNGWVIWMPACAWYNPIAQCNTCLCQSLAGTTGTWICKSAS